MFRKLQGLKISPCNAFKGGFPVKNWLSRKIHQLHSIMWFFGGFFFGSGLSVLSVISLVFAVALDVCISLVLSKKETESGKVDGAIWWSGIR